MRFRPVLHNPEPPGEITSTGAFGPSRTRNVGQTPVSGSFNFIHADLSPYHVIACTLSANGTFKGTLARVEVRGKTDITYFDMTGSGRALDVVSVFRKFLDEI